MTKPDMQWWRDAKFGMFIHWGLYAVPAGIWKGQEIPGIGEWIMKRAQIPRREYEKLADEFNPIRFDAEEWAQLCQDSGMKYMVITSKHHDGFAMYHSQCSDYNIVDRTPFDRDPMKELAAACQKRGIKFGFYYSQTQDWYEKDAVGNDWDFPNEDEKNFRRYLDNKVKPQLKELLTNYGPIGLIWFDTPMTMTKEESQELADYVHSLQPDCLVGGRVGNECGDYRNLGDNEIPDEHVPGDWETPCTLNDTWGFKKNDHNWKSADTVLQLLVDIISKGGNYLLNVGPTQEGVIPEPSCEILREVGRWLERNGEAVYGTEPIPYIKPLSWGRVTEKADKVYLHVFDWSSKVVLPELTSPIERAYPLNNPAAELHWTAETVAGEKSLVVSLPDAPLDEHVSVIVLETNGELRHM